jgi:hypothetical protein
MSIPFPVRRKRGGKAAETATFPGDHADGLDVTGALKTLPEDGPKPSFTPNDGPPATAPIPVIPDVTFAPSDPDVLARVLKGLQNLGPSRGETFRRDFAELPLFREAARAAGWSGLHAGPPVPRFRRRSTDGWYAQEMARTGYATEVAQAQAHAALAHVAGNAAAGFRRAAGHGFRRAAA